MKWNQSDTNDVSEYKGEINFTLSALVVTKQS